MPVPYVLNADMNIGMRGAPTSSRGSRANVSRLGSAQRKIELAETVLSII